MIRIYRLLRPRRRNRLGGNDNCHPTMGSGQVDKSGSGRLRFFASFYYSFPVIVQTLSQAGLASFPNGGPAHDDDIRVGQTWQTRPERLSDNPLDPVADHRAARCLNGDRHSQSCARLARWTGEHREQPVCRTPAATEYLVELSAMPQSAAGRK